MDMRRRRRRFRLVFSELILFALVFMGIFLGVQFVTKSGIFKQPGIVTYDETLTPDEQTFLKEIFTDQVVLDSDVRISARDDITRSNLQENELIYQITVPITDFYSSAGDVSETENVERIPLTELDFTKKLLSVDGEYYLDTFDKGAYYRIISFDSDKYKDEIEPLVKEAFPNNYPSKDTVLTMAQTGVTALSRGMNAKLAEQGDPTFFSKNIAEYLREFDITHTSNEASFSSSASANNICADERFIGTLTDIGLDIVELTGNHNQDCGNEDAIHTLEIYQQNNIQTVGGGQNAETAAQPLNLSQKNTPITLLAYNESTGGITTGEAPGANQYSEADAATQISAAKAQGNFVIVDIQYYECSGYASEYEDTTCDFADSAAGDQIGFFRHLIDLGADIVVGTSAHQPQTFELYGNGAIYYGLGNLFFDQAWWPGTTRSLILSHYFYNGKLLQTKIVPTVYNSDYQTQLLDKEATAWFLERLANARPAQEPLAQW